MFTSRSTTTCLLIPGTRTLADGPVIVDASKLSNVAVRVSVLSDVGGDILTTEYAASSEQHDRDGYVSVGPDAN